MADVLKIPMEHSGRSLFIDGYFTKRILRGDVPKYGYPKNHLPEVGSASMEVVTGFITAFATAK